MESPKKVPPPGIEPGAHGLEGRCSIQLSYGGIFAKKVGPKGLEPLTLGLKGRCSTC